MAKKQNEYVAKKDRKYNNPLKTFWGKALIVFLALIMVASIFASLIYFIVKASQNV